MDKYCPDADWKRDSNNYVAKRYKEDCDEKNPKSPGVARETYFEDIRLQMDAKLWGEEYNRHNPPKKVDIFMTTVYEINDQLDRKGKTKVLMWNKIIVLIFFWQIHELAGAINH